MYFTSITCIWGEWYVGEQHGVRRDLSVFAGAGIRSMALTATYVWLEVVLACLVEVAVKRFEMVCAVRSAADVGQ